MKVEITLPSAAAKAIADLEARKQQIYSLFGNCPNVPAGMNNGGGFLSLAIDEINKSIASVVHVALVERREIA